MIELLKIEFLKIKHYTVFKAFMIIFAVILPLVLFGISTIKFFGFPTQERILGFPEIWGNITYIAGWVNLLPGILVVALVCNEVTFKTQKQNVIDGLSRLDVIMSKFYVVLALSLVITAYVVLLGFAFGLIFSNGGSVFSGFENVLFFFLQTLGIFSLALLLAVIIRIAALSILAYMFVFLLLGVTLGQFLGADLALWMPTNMLADLTPFPLYDTVLRMQRMADNSAEVTPDINQWIRVLISSCYTFGFILLSFFIMKKRDL
ncbi:MAG: ABC-2 type transport system permease protein [Crocinitomix sp.]|jgi:ABC-2 type transport system permease protein